MSVVLGAGRVPNDILVVGEGPGREEAEQGVPFVGRSGLELAGYMQRNGMDLAQAYRTNVCKTYIEGNPDPTPELLELWTPALLQEVHDVQPKVVIAVGAHAARWFLGDRAQLRVVHGLAHRAGAFDSSRRDRAGGAVVVPTYHPAFGFYSNDGRALVGDDFVRVEEVVRAVQEGREPDYRNDHLAGSENYLDLEGWEFALHLEWYSGPLGIDTEGSADSPWSIQISMGPGHGMVLRCSQPDFAVGIAALQRAVDDGALLIGHNFIMHDIDVCRAMGLDLSNARIWDNYYALYLLRLEPLGQKPAAYRWCGMAGRTYKEVMAGAGERRQLDYLWNVRDMDWPKPEPYVEWANDGTCKMKQPNHVHRYVGTMLDSYYVAEAEADDETDADEEGDEAAARTTPLLKRWRSIHPNVRTPVELVLGKFPEPTLDDVPLDAAVYYAARDPDQALRLYHKLVPELRSKGVLPIMERSVEVLPVFEEMQATGIPASRAAFEKLADKMSAEMDALGTHISKTYYGGKPFNPKATEKVESLMRRLGLKGAKRTPKGRMSTGKPSIEHLRYTEPAIDDVLTWREKQHIRDMFCRPTLALMGDSDWQMVKCRLKIANTTTRRLASKDPNLLAFPKHEKRGGDYGKQVRRCFSCPPGQVFLECDYSQAEVRMLAHESSDPLLCGLFSQTDPHTGKPRDVHTETAARVFGVDIRDVTQTQRNIAKRITFGIAYGVTGSGLATQIRMFVPGAEDQGWDKAACDKAIREWLALYKTADDYFRRVEGEVYRTGVVRDHWGMMRYLPAVWSDDEKVAAEARRQAVNHKIQGGAQGLIQNAMAGLRQPIRELQRQGVGVWWTLQVHDALLFRVEEEHVARVEELVLDGMVRYCGLELQVPLLADAKTATTWGDL